MPLQILAAMVPTRKELRVRLAIANKSNRYELFWQAGCSWQESWRTDSRTIGIGGSACTWNPWQSFILAPGQSFEEKELPLFVSGRPGVTSFRFGFTRNKSDFSNEELEHAYLPDRMPVYLGVHRLTAGKEIFWSDPVTITIRKEWIARG